MRISGKPDQSTVMLGIAILMFGNVGALILCGLIVGKRSRWAFLFALVVLSVNIVLTVTDQFGLIDLITMLIDLAILGLLFFDRAKYGKNTAAL